MFQQVLTFEQIFRERVSDKIWAEIEMPKAVEIDKWMHW